ncbi:hypothetical protein V1477_021187 [Vespula maculifrons]|uniref:Uncharacterized protein n=1 Tax=Vespula maculifrons TaxID=7453 RepID=A0ABD2AGF2_VESMC
MGNAMTKHSTSVDTSYSKRVHWIEKTEECFEKQLENLTKERTLSAIARRSNERFLLQFTGRDVTLNYSSNIKKE